MAPRHRRRWRATLLALHRDFGFFAIGLTLVYAVSGIAVNHRHHWNYNYSQRAEVRDVGAPSVLLGVPAGPEVDEAQLARDQQQALVAAIVAKAGRTEPPRKAFWRGPDRLSLFFAGGDEDVIDYLPSQGQIELEVRSERFLIRDMNFLHLNESRDVWTWIGDFFALVMIFLAISGALIVKGTKGLRGRGGMLAVAGILLPIVAVALLR
ncbi:MAG: hypothetical protein CSA24_03045 [Deltaproteobacteria bacterium]|nr:MAG: hypothetical protein CSA24_03045 [Deltaproteobacteria bacterium]